MTLSYHQKEFLLQCCVAEQIPSWFPGLEFTAFPGRPGDGRDGHFKRMMGVKPGIPDLLFTWNDGYLRCGMIELKTDSGRISNDQNKVISAWSRLGWRNAVCRTAQEVFEALCLWGHTPKHSAVEEPDLRSWDQKTQDTFNFYAG